MHYVNVNQMTRVSPSGRIFQELVEAFLLYFVHRYKGLLNVFHFRNQTGALLAYFPTQVQQLPGIILTRRVIHIDNLPAFLERKAQPFSSQGQLQPGLVAVRVDAGSAFSLGVQYALVFIESKGAGRDIKFIRELTDTVCIIHRCCGIVDVNVNFKIIYRVLQVFSVCPPLAPMNYFLLA